jgi:hypothetical protein
MGIPKSNAVFAAICFEFLNTEIAHAAPKRTFLVKNTPVFERFLSLPLVIKYVQMLASTAGREVLNRAGRQRTRDTQGACRQEI